MLKVSWVSGYCGIVDNKMADSLAKAALTLSFFHQFRLPP